MVLSTRDTERTTKNQEIPVGFPSGCVGIDYRLKSTITGQISTQLLCVHVVMFCSCLLQRIVSYFNNGEIKNETSSSVHSLESISSQLNFTLDSDTHTLTFDISINTTYHVQIAAYNRQGIGPFSAIAKLKVWTTIEENI